jgi:hypothetical protein
MIPNYLDRVIYALWHINVPIPSPEGYGHWYLFHLGPYTLVVFLLGWLFRRIFN